MTTASIITEAAAKLVTYYLTDQIPFNINVGNNTVGWSPPMPDHLKNGNILFNIINTDLEDSFTSKNGIVLTVGIDDVVYTKIIAPHEINAVGEFEKPFVLINSFNSPIEYEVVVGSRALSDKVLRKYNSHLFNMPPGVA